MTDKQQKLEVVPPPEEQEEMPLPSDPKVIFLGGLFALALLAAVYVAAEIVLPLTLICDQWHGRESISFMSC